MKKAILYIGLICLFLLVACGPTNVGDTDPVALDFGFTDDELSTVFYQDIDGDFFIDLSGNGVALEILSNLCYFDGANAISEEAEEQFVIGIGAKSITVYTDGSTAYNDGNSGVKAVVIDGDEFDYFCQITEGNIGKVGQYSETAEIVVYNSKNLVCEVEDVAAFLENLNEVKVIKLSNGNDYSLSNEEYKISIDNKVIKIYGDFIKIGSDVYAVLEGDFGFLSELSYSYSSDGFLPWV